MEQGRVEVTDQRVNVLHRVGGDLKSARKKESVSRSDSGSWVNFLFCGESFNFRCQMFRIIRIFSRKLPMHWTPIT